jgi:hypothetical protein
LYFCHYVDRVPTSAVAIVLEVMDSALRVAVIALGVDARMPLSELADSYEVSGEPYSADRRALLRWSGRADLSISVFSELRVVLNRGSGRRVVLRAQIA